ERRGPGEEGRRPAGRGPARARPTGRGGARGAARRAARGAARRAGGAVDPGLAPAGGGEGHGERKDEDRQQNTHDHPTAARSFSTRGRMAAARSLYEARLAMSRVVTSATVSSTSRSFSRRVVPVSTMSTMAWAR